MKGWIFDKGSGSRAHFALSSVNYILAGLDGVVGAA